LSLAPRATRLDVERSFLRPARDVDAHVGAEAAERQKAGRPADVRDTLIAGIALARRATLATRNVRHFHGLKVRVVDPYHE
jgi:toxin FitB